MPLRRSPSLLRCVRLNVSDRRLFLLEAPPHLVGLPPLLAFCATIAPCTQHPVHQPKHGRADVTEEEGLAALALLLVVCDCVGKSLQGVLHLPVHFFRRTLLLFSH